MSNKIKSRATGGFTLVELSIVIVIIGFLVAGIAAGANMVKQAEIRSVISDLQSYQTAYNNFVAKYNAVPGDMTTSDSFWPAPSCGAVTVCNGSGGGIIVVSNKNGPAKDEVRPALKQLALANMISAGITPVAGAAAVTVADLSPGTNAPSSKISGAGYFLAGGNPSIAAAVTVTFPSSTNVVYIGKAATGDNLVNSALTPQDAFSIDQKMDDATVANLDSGSSFSLFNNANAVMSDTTFTGAITGNIMVMDGADGVAQGSCLTPLGKTYNISNGSAACMLGLGLN